MSSHTNLVFMGSTLVVLILLCFWLGYKILDQSVSLDYQVQHTKIIEKQRDLLVKVLNSIGRNINEDRVRSVLTELPSSSVFEKEEGHVVADQVSFFFIEGKLIRVEAGQTDKNKDLKKDTE